MPMRASGISVDEVVIHRGDGLDPVMYKEDLSAAFEFPNDGFTHQALVVGSDVGDDRQAFLWRGVDVGDIPDTGQCHVQCAWNGGGSEGQDVHLGAEFLEVFLVGYPKALLFVDDHQAQIFELHIGRDQAVCANEDVDLLLRPDP